MGWFEQNAPEPIKVGPAANQPVAGNPNAQLAGAMPALPTQQPQTLGPSNNPVDAPIPSMVADKGGTNYQSTFQQIMGGLPATPENLASKEKELQAAGIRVVRSGDGTAGKIGLPNGQIVDVIQGAHAGGGGSWQWLAGSGGSGGGSDLGNFQVGTFTGGGQYPLSSVMGTGLAAPWTTPFNAPDPNSVTNDKALQWQMGRGMEAIQRSAAAKGTLLTGGTLKALDAFGQGLGSTYYNDVYNRKLGEYKMAHDIYEGNQQNQYSRLFGVAGLGQNAAAQVGNAAGEYGQQAGNTMLGQGNAAAAGSVNQGNIWGNAVGGIGNTVADIYALNKSGYGKNPADYPTSQGGF